MTENTEYVKSSAEIEKIRLAGALTARVLEMITDYVKIGITTLELDKICHDFILSNNGIPASLNFQGFPATICTSINHQVCHGLPNKRPLQSGDILNVDVTVGKDGYHGDSSKMFLIGEVAPATIRLVKVTREALFLGIEKAKAGVTLGTIGSVIAKHAHSNGFSVVKEYCGHGIGRELHEPPKVLHYGNDGEGMALKAGMTITIEPMINAGGAAIKVLGDGWTVITKDRMPSAQWEHTLHITDTGCEILTLREEER